MIGKGMVLHAMCALAPLFAQTTALFCHLLSLYVVIWHGKSQEVVGWWVRMVWVTSNEE